MGKPDHEVQHETVGMGFGMPDLGIVPKQREPE